MYSDADPKGFKGRGHAIDRKHCRHLLLRERSGCVKLHPIATLDAATQQQNTALEERRMATSLVIETLADCKEALAADCNELLFSLSITNQILEDDHQQAQQRSQEASRHRQAIRRTRRTNARMLS
jgi:hypothetical protein